jgi:hypothetical protein
MNWKGCRRKLSWPDLRYYTSTLSAGLSKTVKNCIRIINIQGPSCAIPTILCHGLPFVTPVSDSCVLMHVIVVGL